MTLIISVISSVFCPDSARLCLICEKKSFTACRRPEENLLLSIASRVLRMSSFRISIPRLVNTSVDRRVNTARVPCNFSRLPSNSFFSISTRFIMCSMIAWFLPRKPLSSTSCSTTLRMRASIRPTFAAASSPTSAISWSRTISCLLGISSTDKAISRSGRRLFASNPISRLTFPTNPFCADTGKTCSFARCSVLATLSTCRSICAATSSALRNSSHMLSILFSTTIRAGPPPIWSRQTSISLLVTPVSAARMNSTACAFGIRFSVSSGSVPIAFRPGVSMMTSPCFSKGCGKLTIA